MNTKDQVLDSLAIDAITQFRAGVNKIKIGNIEVEAQEVFEFARTNYIFFAGLNEEERLIKSAFIKIVNKIINANPVMSAEELDNAVVEALI